MEGIVVMTLVFRETLWLSRLKLFSGEENVRITVRDKLPLAQDCCRVVDESDATRKGDLAAARGIHREERESRHFVLCLGVFGRLDCFRTWVASLHHRG